VSLALTWPCRLCLFRVLLCGSLCYRLSPFQGDTAPTLSGLHVYLQFMWEVGLPPSPVKFSSHCHFHKLTCSWLLGSTAAPASRHVCLQFTWEVGLPSSPVEFSSLHHSHQLSRSWLLGACPAPAPARASPAHLACLFKVPGRIPFPQSLALSAPYPISCVSLLLLLLITQFLFFPRGEVSLSRGLCCSGPGLSVGVPRYHEAHLVCVFPSRLGASDRGPSLFLSLMWSGDSLPWLEVWRGQSFVFSQWLCLLSVSLASLQDFTIEVSLSASSL
jgi:hypothetical protein